VLWIALVSGSMVIVGLGLAVVLSGESFGWAIVAFGVLDLATVPFVARRVAGARTQTAERPTTAESEGPVTEPTADPSYNPYARED
jgi:membrane protein implicated in regulation of membrane protease activity